MRSNTVIMNWNYRIFLFICVLSICILLLSSCSKNERTHYYISEEVKTYGFFEEYSYWIYQNEVTNQVDCTFVNAPTVFFTENLTDPEDEPLIDHIFVYLESSLLKKFHLTGNYLFAIFQPLTITFSFVSRVKLHESWISGTSKYSCIALYDSLLIADKYFYNVLQTREAALIDPSSSDSIIFNFFLAPDIGLVRIRKTYQQTDTVWNLIRHHVIK